MMRMSPRILGLITCYFLINVLSSAILTSVIHVNQAKYPLTRPLAQETKSPFVGGHERHFQHSIILHEPSSASAIQEDERPYGSNFRFRPSTATTFPQISKRTSPVGLFTGFYNSDISELSIVTANPTGSREFAATLAQDSKDRKLAQKSNNRRDINQLNVRSIFEDTTSNKPMPSEVPNFNRKYFGKDTRVIRSSTVAHSAPRVKLNDARPLGIANKDPTFAFMARFEAQTPNLTRSIDTFNLTSPSSAVTPSLKMAGIHIDSKAIDKTLLQEDRVIKFLKFKNLTELSTHKASDPSSSLHRISNANIREKNSVSVLFDIFHKLVFEKRAQIPETSRSRINHSHAAYSSEVGTPSGTDRSLKRNVDRSRETRKGRVLEQAIDNSSQSETVVSDFSTGVFSTNIVTEVPTTDSENTTTTREDSFQTSIAEDTTVVLGEMFNTTNLYVSDDMSEFTSGSTPDDNSLFLMDLSSKAKQNFSQLVDENGNVTQTPEYDLSPASSGVIHSTHEDPPRQPKMTDARNARRESQNEDRKLNTKKYFDSDFDYDDFRREYGQRQDSSYNVPEFRPGTLVHFPATIEHHVNGGGRTTLPALAVAAQYDGKPPGYLLVLPNQGITHLDAVLDQPFKGARVVASTFYPNRMQEVSLQFATRKVNTTSRTPLKDAGNHQTPQPQDDDEDENVKEPDPGFTMEKLAYLLIGTCCGLSIICLLVVVAAIKCRRTLVERRLRSRFKRHNLYHHHTSPWHQHLYHQFMYLQSQQGGDSCSSKDSCNCRCVTWSLGPRNLDTRPICPTRNSVYLCGPKKLPFGAASTLRYETMLGRGRRGGLPPPPPPRVRPKSDESSNDNDSLNQSSDTDRADTSRGQCTCIDPSWTVSPVPRGSPCNAACPCSDKPSGSCGCPPDSTLDVEFGRRAGTFDCPPPVTGSDYLDRTEGVVYWSSNDERLI